VPARIMIIDPDHDMLDLHTDVLTSEGYRVITARDACSLSDIKCFAPDLC
jgi:DNA-binding response OmpR family regulator